MKQNKEFSAPQRLCGKLDSCPKTNSAHSSLLPGRCALPGSPHLLRLPRRAAAENPQHLSAVMIGGKWPADVCGDKVSDYKVFARHSDRDPLPAGSLCLTICRIPSNLSENGDRLSQWYSNVQQASDEQGNSKTSGRNAATRRPRAGGSRFGWHSLRRFRRPLAVLIVAVLFFSRHVWWPPGFHVLAERSLRAQAPQQALRYLATAEWLGSRRLDTALLRCRAARRAGDPVVIRKAIDELNSRGAAPALQRRELLLFQAQSGEMAEAGPWLSRLLTDETGDNRDVCISYVIGYLRLQRYQEAGGLVNALMQDDPDDAFPWYVRGRVFALQQQFPRAEADFREALSRCPEWLEPVVCLAEVLGETHRQREALPFYERALEDPRIRARAAAGMAESLKAVGDPERARRVLQETIESGQGDANVWISLGRSEFEDGKYESAASALERGLELRPWADDALFVLAQCRRQLGQTTAADAAFSRLEEFRKAAAELRLLDDRISAGSKSVEDRLRSGELMLRFKDPQDGVVVLQGVLDTDPRNRRAHELLAEHFRTLQPQTESTERQRKFHEAQLR